MSAIRYIEMNPVKTRMVGRPEEYRWSSARARILGLKDPLLSDLAVDETATPWRGFVNDLGEGVSSETIELHERTGRPLGDSEFVSTLEKLLKRSLFPGKPGKKPRRQHTESLDLFTGPSRNSSGRQS